MLREIFTSTIFNRKKTFEWNNLKIEEKNEQIKFSFKHRNVSADRNFEQCSTTMIPQKSATINSFKVLYVSTRIYISH